MAAHVRGLTGCCGTWACPPVRHRSSGTGVPGQLHLAAHASAGWWEPAVRVGEAVSAGQVLGTVSTLDGGTVLETFSAPADGVVLFLTSSPAVAADGLRAFLGQRRAARPRDRGRPSSPRC